MTEPEQTQEEELTAEKLEEIDAGIRRKLYLFGRMLSEEYQMTHKVPEDNNTRGFLLNMFASYSTARSVERQEVLVKQMHEESERMTSLTRCIKIMTGAVLVVAVFQAILVVIQVCGK